MVGEGQVCTISRRATSEEQTNCVPALIDYQRARVAAETKRTIESLNLYLVAEAGGTLGPHIDREPVYFHLSDYSLCDAGGATNLEDSRAEVIFVDLPPSLDPSRNRL